jgi:hypothetical protein
MRFPRENIEKEENDITNSYPKRPLPLPPRNMYSDRKENQISSYMRTFRVEQRIYEKFANISQYMRRPLVIYDFATARL